MSSENREKQNAMIKACEMAGFEVVRRNPLQPEHGMVLVDDMGQKYDVIARGVIKRASTNELRATVVKVATNPVKKTTVKALRGKRMRSNKSKSLKAKKQVWG